MKTDDANKYLTRLTLKPQTCALVEIQIIKFEAAKAGTINFATTKRENRRETITLRYKSETSVHRMANVTETHAIHLSKTESITETAVRCMNTIIAKILC